MLSTYTKSPAYSRSASVGRPVSPKLFDENRISDGTELQTPRQIAAVYDGEPDLAIFDPSFTDSSPVMYLGTRN